MTEVTLSWTEVRLAAFAGVDQRIRALDRAARQNYGTPDAGSWEGHVVGQLGELAVAKALDRYWQGGVVYGQQTADVGRRVEVRTTVRADGCLILHPADVDDRPYVLVVGVPPTFRLVGWITGAAGKRPEWWRTAGVRFPAYFVPAVALRPVTELVEEVPS